MPKGMTLTICKHHSRTLKGALKLWGENAQINMACGEIGELLTLVGRHAQKRDTQEQWLDEMADVLIMMKQLMYIKGITSEQLDSRVEIKLAKLRDKVEAEFNKLGTTTVDET